MRSPLPTPFLFGSIVLMAAFTGAARGVPGDVLPQALPRLEIEGRVSVARITADQGVVIAGGFWSVNGVLTPNFARLRPDGALDPGFQSELGLVNGFLSSYDLHERALKLFALSDGRVWVGVESPDAEVSRRWMVLDAEGRLRPDDFPSLPRLGAGTFSPQFEANGKLVLRQLTGRYAEAALRRVTLADGTEDAAFAPRLPDEAPPMFATPADEEKIWVGGRVPGASFFPASQPARISQTLYRLHEDGTKDADFATQSFAEGNLVGLFARPGAEVTLVFQDTLDFIYRSGLINSAPLPVVRLGFDGAARGRQVWSGLYATNGINPCPVQEADGSLLVLRPPDLSVWWRYTPGGERDPAFALAADASGSLERFPDGRLLVNGQRRVLVSGETDPSWTPPQLRQPGYVAEMATAPEGGVYALGGFDFLDGRAVPPVVRLRAGGSLDETFTLDPRATGALTRPASLPDGRLYLLEQVFSAERGRNYSRIIRLLATGTLDPGFAPFGYQPGDPLGDLNVSPTDFVAFPDGSLIAIEYSTHGPAVPTARKYRIRADGSFDPSFPEPFEEWQQTKVLPLPDGRFWVGHERFSPSGVKESALPLDDTGYERVVPAVLLPDGRVLFHRRASLAATTPDGSGWDPGFVFHGGAVSESSVIQVEGGKFHVLNRYASTSRSLLSRYFADGRRDPAFHVPVPRRHTVPPGVVEPVLGLSGISSSHAILGSGQLGTYSLLVHPSAVWLGGYFTEVAGKRRDSLVRLETGAPAGYAAWIAAVLRDPAYSAESRREDADPDHDGAPNFLEYATGSDPLAMDAELTQPQLLATAPLTVAFYRNPDAPEITLVPEVSENGADWRVATAAEVSVRPSTGLRTVYQVAAGAPIRFVRGRYTQAP